MFQFKLVNTPSLILYPFSGSVELLVANLLSTYLANYHEHGEKEDEVSFRNREPVSLLQCEKDCAIQTSFCRARREIKNLSRRFVYFASGPEWLFKFHFQSDRKCTG